eukprot:SAG11_NODE_8059_length_1064_cov_1.123316_1_plen_67_part_01
MAPNYACPSRALPCLVSINIIGLVLVELGSLPVVTILVDFRTGEFFSCAYWVGRNSGKFSDGRVFFR